MEISKVEYLGELRTSASHNRSGKTIITDAPTDNKGKGEAFSPTDLLSTSLASCMITLMGIAAQEKDISLGTISAKVEKEMGSGPRRVIRIGVKIIVEDPGFSEKEKTILKNAAINCPVAKSLHPEIFQDISIDFIP